MSAPSTRRRERRRVARGGGEHVRRPAVQGPVERRVPPRMSRRSPTCRRRSTRLKPNLSKQRRRPRSASTPSHLYSSTIGKGVYKHASRAACRTSPRPHRRCFNVVGVAAGDLVVRNFACKVATRSAVHASAINPTRRWGRARLNELALRNVSLKLVTDDVSHRLISWLNSVLSLNSLVMSVTRDTSQGPSGALVTHGSAPDRHRAEEDRAHPVVRRAARPAAAGYRVEHVRPRTRFPSSASPRVGGGQKALHHRRLQSSAVSLATCVQPEAAGVAGRVGEHVRRPAVGSVSSSANDSYGHRCSCRRHRSCRNCHSDAVARIAVSLSNSSSCIAVTSF